jgi:hypothetical protein
MAVEDATAMIDVSMDSLALQSVDAPALTVDDAAPLDAATNIEPAPDASPVSLDAFGGRQTFSATICGMQDAQAAPPPACPCNGAVAVCALPDAGAAECTSTDLRDQTCESLGFTGGSLGCSASCSFDTSGCDTCVAGPYTVCASLHVADGVASKARTDDLGHLFLRTDDSGHLLLLTDVAFALAASDAEIGLAWGDGNSTLHFTRFAADLTVLSDSCIATLNLDALSLASTSAGWMIAAHGCDGAAGACDPYFSSDWKQIFLYPLDHAGRARGFNHVLTVAKDNQAPTYFRDGPTLSSLSTGNRLLLSWVEDNSYYCFGATCPHFLSRVLVDDGSSVASPDGGDETIDTLDPTTQGTGGRAFWAYSSVAVDDGFAVETTDHGLSHLSHVALDRTIRINSLATSTQITNVKLAWSGSELRLLYQTLGNYSVVEASYGPGMAFLQRISAAGALIGNPALIADRAGYALNHNTLLALGPDSVVHVTESANSHYSACAARLERRSRFAPRTGCPRELPGEPEGGGSRGGRDCRVGCAV